MRVRVRNHKFALVSALFAGAILATGPVSGQDAGTATPIQVGPEISLATNGPVSRARDNGAVAYGDGVYLAVWREGAMVKGEATRVCMARIAKDGRLLDSEPLEIGKGDSVQRERPRVAFLGHAFLVIWQEFNGKDLDVRGARVSPEGKVLDQVPLEIAAGPHTQALAELAAGSNSWLVAWQGFDGKDPSCHIYWALISAEGKVGTAVRRDGWPTSNPRLAWNGSEYLVIGNEPKYAAQKTTYIRLDATGNPVPKGEGRASHGAGDGSLAGMPGTGWLFVLHRSNPDFWGWGGPGAMRAFAIRQSGSWDVPPGKEAETPQLGQLQPTWLDVAYGKDEKTTWPNGHSAVAWDGKRNVAVWSRFRCVNRGSWIEMANGDVVAGRVEGWKPVDQKAPVTVSASPDDERNPALASDGAGNLLCVYEKKVAGSGVQLCARTMSTGGSR